MPQKLVLDSANADLMAPFLLVTKSSPPSGGLREKIIIVLFYDLIVLEFLSPSIISS